jgi:hypothetical protein
VKKLAHQAANLAADEARKRKGYVKESDLKSSESGGESSESGRESSENRESVSDPDSESSAKGESESSAEGETDSQKGESRDKGEIQKGMLMREGQWVQAFKEDLAGQKLQLPIVDESGGSEVSGGEVSGNASAVDNSAKTQEGDTQG